MKLKKNITICGIKHSGKSCTAARLAELLGCRCFDTDDVIMDLYQRGTGKKDSVRNIFRKLGNEAFRELEARAVREVCSAGTGCVISLGGGVFSNRNLTEQDFLKLGDVFCLDVPDSVAFSRIMSEGVPPFLQSEPDPFSAFRIQNEERRKQYYAFSRAVIRPEGKTPEETAQHILTFCKELIK